MDTKSLKIAVIGGGVCGLTVSIGLQRAGLDVELYEAAAKFGEVGAAVGIGPNAIRALKEMDLLDAILNQIKPQVPFAQPFRFISGSDHEIVYDYPMKPEYSSLGIHRAVFLDALVHLFDSSRAHFNKRCVSVKELPSSRMEITFTDGTTAEADIVLGADGVRSRVRTFVVVGPEAPVDPGDDGNGRNEESDVVRVAFANTLAYRGLVPAEQAVGKGVQIDLTKRAHCFIGKDKHVIVIPIQGGKLINVAAFTCDRSIPYGTSPLTQGTPWVSTRTSEELVEAFSDFSTDVRALLGAIASPSAWAIHTVNPPLKTFVRGRTALLGDAAHAMLPHLGAGAGQAIEDARVLVKLLTHPHAGKHNIEDVLIAYDALRRERANSVLTGSIHAGEVYEYRGPHAPEGIEGVRKDLEGHWEFVWEYDLEAAINATIADLEARGIF